MTTKILKIAISTLILTLFFSCGSKYAKVKIKDANAKSALVYGEIDGKARQLKNTYPAATAETTEKANAFRALVESELVSAKR